MRTIVADKRMDRVAERRARVIEAARRLFLSRGFHAASIAQIAEAAGIAVQQMYRDFGSKEGIICAIVEDDIAGLFAAVDSAVATAGQGREALRGWLQEVLLRVLEPGRADLRAEIFAEAQRNTHIAELVRKVGQRMRAAIETVVAAYSPPGRGPEEIAVLTECIVQLISSGSQMQTEAVSAESVAARLAAMLETDIVGKG